MEVPLGGGGIISTRNQVSPPKDLQIHAQTGKSGGIGDVGGIFRLYLGSIVMEKQKLAFVDGKKGRAIIIVVIDSHQIR